MTSLFHIVDAQVWEAAQQQGVYTAASLAQEGFIHLSEAGQVEGVGNRFFLGQRGLVILEIEAGKLQAELRYEEVPGHGRFPHLYGVLNVDAVVNVWPFEPGQAAPTLPS